jgi:hypothetical protein
MQTVLAGAPALALAGWILIGLSDAWRAAIWADVGGHIEELSRRSGLPIRPVAFGWRLARSKDSVTWRWTPWGVRITCKDSGGRRSYEAGVPFAVLADEPGLKGWIR